ncbi:hypothetical protein C882_3173 [Caenispirillum salinarum AK4]|uniref:Uncharacterized protein n=1 Tax=Caenispirillum salinarum AK4 TaxID=1238182 RepID=K9H4W1_9PROT|nr:hypothetical protein C882_3173 [Caenispirillum salinarum AK4]
MGPKGPLFFVSATRHRRTHWTRQHPWTCRPASQPSSSPR